MKENMPLDIADIIVQNALIITMDQDRRVVPDGFVAIKENKIQKIGSGKPETGLIGEKTQLIDAKGGVILPGFISTHQHVIDILLRGLNQEKTLFDWCVNIYYPGTMAFESEDVNIAVQLGMDEAIRAGITTVVDNWSADLDPIRSAEAADAAIQAYEKTGGRVIFARMFSDAFPKPWEPWLNMLNHTPDSDCNELLEDTQTALSSIETLINKYNGRANNRINVCPSPTGTTWNTVEGMQGASELAKKYDTILPIHHSETIYDRNMYSDAWPGLSATQYLEHIGLLDERLLAAHCVWFNEHDIRLFADSGCNVAHCPSSNMMTGTGIAPIASLIRAGVTVGLGCDNAMVNNNVSLLNEIRLSAFLAKTRSNDAGALSAEQSLAMATCDGAKAIGRGQDLGVIEEGRIADIILLDTNATHWVPTINLDEAIVFQAHPHDVKTVIIDGNIVMQDRELKWLNQSEEQQLFANAHKRSDSIIQRAGLEHFRKDKWQNR